ncbi:MULTISPECIES: Arc family DNA-binding protein [Rhizobium/Agrobacterium group]|uniref:Arc family DNA-binding protein n=1 Tax=Agrobacterium vitis TaxID=373 RepID=A0ABD6H423_AGRVI|nr:MULTISPECIES: Arc family DNA-binding protein [Rhizobium/Agrobacterium group]MUO27425.1 Arc family DNA-binding protein [Agrobacterium vitis]MUO42125.1 Arc family DNA-binding protein [Agrobacterium vitis]MUP09433.1 Arc family DNA-binding protein [Agrobacterium vitis]
MVDRTPQDQDKYVLRFPDGLRDRLKDEAARNNRSLNAEIIHRLENSFASLPEMEQDDLQSIIRQIDIVKYNLVQAHSKKKRESDGKE